MVGLTREKRSQMTVFAVQQVGGDAAGVLWCPSGAPPRNSNSMSSGRWWHARGRRYCRGKPGRAQQRSIE